MQHLTKRDLRGFLQAWSDEEITKDGMGEVAIRLIDSIATDDDPAKAAREVSEVLQKNFEVLHYRNFRSLSDEVS